MQAKKADVSAKSKLESVFHPSDFSEASEIAFAHALKIALVARAKLTMLHVAASPRVEWQDFPGVRDTLERWKLIPKDSPKSAVPKLGIQVSKRIALGRDPAKACLTFLKTSSTDLIVLAVHQHDGRMRWLAKSVGSFKLGISASGPTWSNVTIPAGSWRLRIKRVVASTLG